MKILGALLNGLLVISLAPALAQQPASQTGKIHGHVTNYTGQPQPAGMICLSTDGGVTAAYTFPLKANGTYAGEAPAGTYTLVYRMPDTPPSLWIDAIQNVAITAGKDLEQNDDMSRPEFIADLPDEQKKQLEEMKKQSATAINQESTIKAINAELNSATQDLKEADNARSTAQRELGRTASPAEINAKAASIKASKCADAESLTQKALQSFKNSGLAGDETALWQNLGRAQLGLQKYNEAEQSFKRVLEIQGSSSSPQVAVQALANAGLGEVDARSGRSADASKAYDLAVQFDPAHAVMFLKNEAAIFQQTGDAEAQVAAAEKAIGADPKDPVAYYLKGNGLFKKAGIDPAKKHYDLPAGCAEAYQKYLTLAPGGPYASEAQSVLRRAAKATSAAK